MNFIKYFFYLSLLLLSACAHIVGPSGGPRDMEAPKVLSVVPANKSTSLQSGTVIIKMDEYINIADANKNISIVPNTSQAPIVTALGKELRIKLPKDLQANTTYTIYFGKAIQDITEKNTLADFRYVFSTGSSIDSLSIGGSLNDYSGERNFLNYYIGLYDYNANIQDIKNAKTLYLIRPEETGNFLFENIKPGAYRIVAFHDDNKNKKYDAYKENIGYSIEVLNPSDPKASYVSLPIFLEKSDTTMLIKSTNYTYNKTVLKFNRPIENLTTTLLDTLYNKNIVQQQSGDSITLWHVAPSAKCRVLLLFDNHKDTIDLYTSIKNKKQLRSGKVTLTSNVQVGKLDDDTLKLQLSPYITSLDKTKIVFSEDGKIKKDFSILPSINSATTHLELFYPFQINKKYLVTILPEAYSDPFSNVKNDSVNIGFQLLKSNEKGSLKITELDLFKNPKSQILFLYNDKKELILAKKLNDKLPITINALTPGTYTARVLNDENQNSIFDAGVLQKFSAPESMINILKKIEIRPGFETQVVLNSSHKR